MFLKIIVKDPRGLNFFVTEKKNTSYKTMLLKQVFTCACFIFTYMILGLLI